MAIKETVAWQVQQAMEKENITKVEMARRMKTTRAAPSAAACGRISITTSCSSAVAKCISRSTENLASLYPFTAETFG